MTDLEKELLAALKEEHRINCYGESCGSRCPTCQLIAKAEAQEANDERNV